MLLRPHPACSAMPVWSRSRRGPCRFASTPRAASWVGRSCPGADAAVPRVAGAAAGSPGAPHGRGRAGCPGIPGVLLEASAYAAERGLGLYEAADVIVPESRPQSRPVCGWLPRSQASAAGSAPAVGSSVPAAQGTGVSREDARTRRRRPARTTRRTAAAGVGTTTSPRRQNRRRKDQTPWARAGNERALGARPWRPGLVAATVHGLGANALLPEIVPLLMEIRAQSRARFGPCRAGEADRGDAPERARRRGAGTGIPHS